MEIGNVVYLNSNPEVLMTVEYILGSDSNGTKEKFLSQQMKMQGFENGDVYCTWFDGKTLKNGCFKSKMLTKQK